MLNVIEVGPQVNVNDLRLDLHNRLSHSVHRLMRCPFRSVSIRTRLKISFEDRLQNELHRPLNHTVADSRNRQDGDFLAPSFGIFFFRPRMGRYVRVTSSSLICIRKPSLPPASMASNVTPSIPG